MGSFYTNVQVRTTDQAAVAAAVQRFAEASGLDLIDDDAAADRTIVIAPAGAWSAIYDQGTEDQDDRKLAALATAVSACGPAVGVLIHDSDVLLLQLCRDGAVIDRYVNAPGYFGRVSKAEQATTRGDAARWSELLVAGATPATLRAAWDDRPSFAEAQLARIGELLGWSEGAAGVGHTHLGDEPPAGAIALRFRLRARPLHEQHATGAPRFMRGAYNPEIELAVGDLLTLRCSVISTGGPARGLVLAVWGPAIDQALIAPREVTIARTRGDARLTWTAPLVREGGAWFARLADCEVPAGLVSLDAVARAPAGTTRAAREAWHACAVDATITGAVAAAGDGSLHIGFVPGGDRDGQMSHTIHLRVSAPLRRPSRARAEAPSHALRPLAVPGTGFALIALDVGGRTGPARAEVNAALVAAIERWHGVVGDDDGSYQLVWSRSAAHELIQRTSKARRLSTSKAWREIAPALAEVRAFSAELGRSPRFEDRHDFGRGFSVNRARVDEDDAAGDRDAATDPALPHLGLWCGIAALAPEAREARIAALRAIVDEVVARVPVAQAMVGRWAWAPQFMSGTTAYEHACGITGDDTGRQRWCRRYLRGVTGDGVWLGPDLQRHLPEGALAAAGAVRVLDRGVACVTAGPTDADLDRAEAALAPVLPSAGDRA
ncbi:MAG: hypothetical protein K8W52_35245 [Deltaproteobacteria bacterium]|nr:hypothetical protein [Deltaproteobacteria bacterium]